MSVKKSKPLFEVFLYFCKIDYNLPRSAYHFMELMQIMKNFQQLALNIEGINFIIRRKYYELFAANSKF